MKRLIVVFTLVVLLAGGLYFIKTRTNKGTETVPQQALSVDFIECHISPTYYVVNESSSERGSRVLVKYKSSPEESFNCAYEVNDGDFEISDSSFLSLTDNFVVVGDGLRTNQGNLTAYNLENREASFTEGLIEQVSMERVGRVGDVIKYFVVTDEGVTVENCPEVLEHRAEGARSVILSQVQVDLATGEKAELGVTECVAAS